MPLIRLVSSCVPRSTSTPTPTRSMWSVNAGVTTDWTFSVLQRPGTRMLMMSLFGVLGLWACRCWNGLALFTGCEDLRHLLQELCRLSRGPVFRFQAIEDLCPIRADHFRASHRQGDCFRQLAHFCSGLPTWFCKSDRGLLRRAPLAAGVPVFVRHALRHHWRSQHPFRPS